MNKRDIVIGILVLVAVAVVIFLVRRPKVETPIETPNISTEERFEDKFKLEIPEDVDKAELKDVTEGNQTGLATRKFENGTYEHSILADLSEPGVGEFYQGWLEKENGDYISTGRLRVAKGGFVLEFQSNLDYSQYNKVYISLEKVADENPETKVLEGSF